MKGILKILFVEDVISDAELIWREIEKNHIVFEKLVVIKRNEFINALKSFLPDIIISDYKLPHFDGMSALRLRNEITPLIPFILVTGSINEEVAVECMKAGADDYILKENLARLGPAVINSINKIELLKQKIEAENALRESEERFRILYNDAAVGLYRTNSQGEILMANKTLIKMLGYQTFEELASINLNISKYIPADQRRQFIEQIEKEGEIRDLEAIWYCKDGEEIFIKESAKTIRNSEGKIIFYDGIVEDITGRKKAELELRDSQKLIEGILNAIPARVFWKDLNLVYLGCNTIFAHDAGFTEPKDIIGKNDYQMVWRDQAELYRGDDWEVIKTGNPKFLIEESQTTPDGNIITLLTSKVPLLNSNGEIRGILGTYIDITDRKQAEESLISERSLLRTLIDNLPALIYVKDAFGRKILANKADVKYIGLNNEEDVIGKTDNELFPGKRDKSGYGDDIGVITSGEALLNREEVYSINKNDVPRWLLTSKIPLFDKAGKVTGLVGIGHDITDIKNKEAELILAKEKAEESDKLKTAFLNNISHEIRTPLNAIVGFASLLGSSELSPDKKKEFVNIIYASNDQLLSIISGILSLASLEAGQVQITKVETDLNKILLNVYEQFMVSQFSAEVSFNYHPGLSDSEAIILTDPVKLSQILINLVENALKFTRQGKVNFGYNLSGHILQFFVEDTGIGIPPEMIELIFERFRQVDNSPTRKYGGIGLGLSLSKGYVELLGGSIKVVSEPGLGSVFSFTIPYIPVTLTTTDAIATPTDEVIFAPGKTVLLAEDEDFNFMLINEILTDMQLKVIRAENGLEAVNLCSPGNIPDLVLMDIKMPVMDGVEATKIIKELNPRLPVIVLTAYALAADEKDILLSGCDAYIKKPINRQILINTMSKFLAG